MATAFLIIVVLFLSLCDPKPHHAGEGHGHAATTEAGHHEAAPAHHNEAAAPAAGVVEKDSMPVESTVPAAEPAHH